MDRFSIVDGIKRIQIVPDSRKEELGDFCKPRRKLSTILIGFFDKVEQLFLAKVSNITNFIWIELNRDILSNDENVIN